MSRKYTNAEFIEAVASSISYREVKQKIGLSLRGPNNSVKQLIVDLNLDISHFTGQGHGKTKNRVIRSIEDYLSNKQKISSWELKHKLIKLELLKNKCYVCGLTDWQDKPLSLDIDHIDGNHYNNNLDNLRILCPNCHRQTDTFGSKRLKGKKHKLYDYKTKEFEIKKSRSKRIISCIKCGVECHGSKHSICKKCYSTPCKIQWPTVEKMKELVWSISTSQIAKELGVSDSAISKFCKKNNINKPPRGYWAKQYANVM